jgi:hypothetical protein
VTARLAAARSKVEGCLRQGVGSNMLVVRWWQQHFSEDKVGGMLWDRKQGESDQRLEGRVAGAVWTARRKWSLCGPILVQQIIQISNPKCKRSQIYDEQVRR